MAQRSFNICRQIEANPDGNHEKQKEKEKETEKEKEKGTK